MRTWYQSTPLRTVVLALLASAGPGCTLEEPEIGRERSALNVSDMIISGCSTEGVIQLSKQIGEEVACMMPGALADFSESSVLQFSGAAVLPFLSPLALQDLQAAAANSSEAIRLNSVYRTLPQQFLLYKWYQAGSCNIPIAAEPGKSNHESAKAIDVGNHAEVADVLNRHGWEQTVVGDLPHFVHHESADLRGFDILAFQRLWNRNHPNDRITEDSQYGPITESKMLLAPAEGFAIGACPSSSYDSGEVLVDMPAQLQPGTVAEVTVFLRNIGEVPWQPGITYLGSSVPFDRASELYVESSWFSKSRTATVSSLTQPGDVGTFVFDIRAPEREGEIHEMFQLIEESVTWFGSEPIQIAFEVSKDAEPYNPAGRLQGGCGVRGQSDGGYASLLFLALVFARLKRRNASVVQ